MEITKVTCIHELIQAVAALAKKEALRWWFRGQASAAWDVLPSVRRGYSREQERQLSNEFYVRAGTRRSSCPEARNFAGWLSLMQHYGLPTRLLDWTASPLIAAYFSVFDVHAPPGDACIWALAPGKLNEAQGFEPLLYPLDAQVLVRLLKPAMKGKDSTSRIAAAMAVETDVRMLMQQGAFTVHAADTALNSMPGCDRWLRKFVVPAQSMGHLRRELRLLGYRVDYLFPDLESLATELKDSIRPKRP